MRETVDQLFSRAVQLHQQSELKSAQALYKKVIKKQPTNAQAHHLLGIIYHQQKREQLSEKHLQLAINLNPFELSYIIMLINTQMERQEYSKVIQWLEPKINGSDNNHLNESPEILQQLGNCFLQTQQFSDAIKYFERCLLQDDNNWVNWLSLGNCLFELNNYLLAQSAYQKVLEINPNQIDASNNIATVYLRQNDYSKALSAFYQVIEIDPEHYVAWGNLAQILLKLRQLDDAVICAQKSLQINADYQAAQYIMALIYKEQANFPLALDIFQRLVDAEYAPAMVFNAIGNIYYQTNQLELAQTYYQNALNQDAHYTEALFNLALVKSNLKQHMDAISFLDELLTIDPNYHSARPLLLHLSRQTCQWEKSKEQLNICRQLLKDKVKVDLPPFTFITLDDSTSEEQQLVAQHWIDYHVKSLITEVEPADCETTGFNNKQRIKLGYLSADFHEHATAYLLIQIIEQHDRKKFEVFGYSYGPNDNSLMRARIIQGFEHFCDLANESIESMAAIIKNDEIDILLDLKGFTQNTRSQVLALHPAPIQINYLGYPASMGNALVNFVITDQFTTPKHSHQFSETPLYLPNCYQPNDASRVIPLAPDRALVGLPETGIVFGAFHQTYKINSEILNAWSNVLLSVDNSVLWCLSSDPKVNDNIRALFLQKGIQSDRIIFATRTSAEEHLARLQLVDLMLDTFPVNGHTSTSDALWCEVPVLTIAGETFISRVAGSILTTLGLTQLICQSIEQYQQRAIEISTTPLMLAQLKQQIQQSKENSPLFNSLLYTRNLEKLLLETCNSR